MVNARINIDLYKSLDNDDLPAINLYILLKVAERMHVENDDASPGEPVLQSINKYLPTELKSDSKMIERIFQASLIFCLGNEALLNRDRSKHRTRGIEALIYIDDRSIEEQLLIEQIFKVENGEIFVTKEGIRSICLEEILRFMLYCGVEVNQVLQSFKNLCKTSTYTQELLREVLLCLQNLALNLYKFRDARSLYFPPSDKKSKYNAIISCIPYLGVSESLELLSLNRESQLILKRGLIAQILRSHPQIDHKTRLFLWSRFIGDVAFIIIQRNTTNLKFWILVNYHQKKKM